MTNQTHHGDLPASVAAKLVCPAREADAVELHGPAIEVEVVEGSGYRAKFRCRVCRFEFTVSDAQLRRLM